MYMFQHNTILIHTLAATIATYQIHSRSNAWNGVMLQHRRRLSQCGLKIINKKYEATFGRCLLR